ncbi:asparagine synthase-related protein [Streptomyces sp. XD-27]|uniref:asparagine synthase-related protein n=1 Tax=Streptomyces sp. XD-27 TaxID=3062779 RepID=UPI0026F4741D|nr:asparagine synthase-related protein [Streptomyces sp. XD-27]WKX73962.1 asparagine synthase-related protein [Streptomyces sp. XD-27]
MVGSGMQYFVVLPDHETAAAAVDRLPPGSAQIMRHRSGRPWVAGRLAADRVLSAEDGDTRLAVVGHCSATPTELAAAAARISDVAQLDGLGTSWAGSYHLLASVAGRLYVRGSASGLRRVFHASLRGFVFAADRADVLAALLDAPLDRSSLALRLLDAVPHPLGERPVWRGIAAVPPGFRLTLSPDGLRHTVTRWWQPPEPVQSLAEGATALRQALEDSVKVRTRGLTAISCDLSGGMDSTSLTVLAAREQAQVTAFTMENDDQADDDAYWARKAAAHLPQVNHVVFPSHDVPGFFEELLEIDDVPDEPSIALLSAPRLRAGRERASAHAHLHLDGFGGDQVLSGHPAYYHDLLRSRPWSAFRQLRTVRLLTGFALGTSVRTLLDGSSYRRWLAAEAHALAGGQARRPRNELFDWGGSLRLPDWLAPDAADLVADALHEAAGTAEPLAPARGRHGDLLAIQEAGRMIRQFHQLVETPHYAQSSPFLDDQVLSACLAVRADERVTPWEFKPLVKAAMADVMPRELLQRRTKADGSMIAAEGFERSRRELAALWETSRLAELGLIRPEPLRELFRRPYTARLHEGAMPVALGCELWARAATASAPDRR